MSSHFLLIILSCGGITHITCTPDYLSLSKILMYLKALAHKSYDRFGKLQSTMKVFLLVVVFFFNLGIFVSGGPE